MDKSEQVDKLFGALAQAQGEFEAVAFDAVNPFLKNQYATLGAVIEAAKPVLVKNELSVSQLVTSHEDRVGVTTVLGHSSGQWISETVTLSLSDEKGKSAAQVAGSIVTYLRRYALAAILGLYAEADDDGNAGGEQGGKKPEQKKQAPQKPATPKPEFPAPAEPDKAENKTAELVTLWDGQHQKPANELIDNDTAVKVIKANIGVGKFFESQNHAKAHLHAHYNIAYDLKDTMAEIVKRLTWKQLVALMKHIKGMGDDPEWYPAKFGKTPEVHDHESSSGYSDDYLNSIVALWSAQDERLAGVKDYAGLSDERKVDMMTFLTSSVGDGKNIRADDLATIAGVLAA